MYTHKDIFACLCTYKDIFTYIQTYMLAYRQMQTQHIRTHLRYTNGNFLQNNLTVVKHWHELIWTQHSCKFVSVIKSVFLFQENNSASKLISTKKKKKITFVLLVQPGYAMGEEKAKRRVGNIALLKAASPFLVYKRLLTHFQTVLATVYII